MRSLILTPRWIMFHVLTLGAMITCGLLAAWQWGKAGSAMGSALNVGYGLQWPVFAVFFGYMWWRLLSLEAAALRAAPGDAPEVVERAPVAAPPPVDRGAPTPFGPRPVSYVSDEDDEREGRAMSAYNRMLAQLAARDSEE